MRAIDEMNQPKQWFTLGEFWNCLDLSRSLIHFNKGWFDPRRSGQADGVIGFSGGLKFT